MKDKKTSIKGEAVNRSQCNNQKKKNKWTDNERTWWRLFQKRVVRT